MHCLYQYQIDVLIREFNKNKNWTRTTIDKIAKETGLKPTQVYKWGWDQKKKLALPTKNIYSNKTLSLLRSRPENSIKKSRRSKRKKKRVFTSDMTLKPSVTKEN